MVVIKANAIKVAKTGRKLAAVLGVTPQAVSKWPAVMPELYAYKLKCIKPRWFAAAVRMAETAEEA